VIRLKLNRNSAQAYTDSNEKEHLLKLKDKPLANQFTKQFDKFFIEIPFIYNAKPISVMKSLS
jgi:hypothetical protein